MEILTIILLGTLIAIVVGAVIFIIRLLKLQQKPPEDSQALLMLQNQLSDLTKTMDQRMNESSRFMNESMKSQFGESQRLVNQFMKELTTMTDKVARVEETGKQMVTFADQLQNLQDILKNPKQRGVLGEYYLETVLQNVLPPGSYEMQHRLGHDEDTGKELIPDAVIFVKNKIIPVDSKFSLENYNRIIAEHDPAEKEKLEKIFKQDLKNRIDETSKYVRPKDDTMDFAFMFIPSEGVYYDLLVNGAVKTSTKDLIEYAFSKHVIIVSPTSFLAYLQTVLQGLKALQIEESAKEIRKRVEELGRHLGNYEMFMQKIGGHLGTTVNAYNSAYKELSKIDKDVLKIAGEGIGVEPVLVGKPDMEE
ncbi:MAG: hypothetical protein A3H69_05725 [Candidatus Sungbacteria bacterium RIFCSPLOWO2_02_FULL_47_9]|uniref:DNA recombination protein RmuC n=1 Tax=Candidatus Sungbacteria bacterium RIFCSPHIGHO2_01_FULL_47_32 TaxID=1802264 RepID=A0A1G2K8M2_9BACT|nr:MAG: hypothetical protein UX72_C0004G0066 [Parcubacteria group bacterium GW2011_GWA2_47_10]OGZ95779.1 MAG: hypothetical protein A2633_00600 [Candidatus Sungbacteria bacterium RIFCSPHIGHO2_01_FULL_47_32]OHA04586.1 MAG: hypothetical protein A3A28_01345 [Candidatus Sungbacteria bacterium RIFCSPLOWO2_01_FULL_47_32]OHA10131.1 MAG: hypothetical protein A3H69_05725 [Candidatus Sungbacteria bacterium RIFCSPLOWO2_02_FULL_47_9]